MKPTILLTLCAVLPAQEPETVTAEQRFQDAYWAETGQGDLQAALKGYLAAAEAPGSEAFRAKALLRAAEIQHRLGQKAEALAGIGSLIERFPGERDVVALARSVRSEWQEIDLRKNYSDWYQRQLFTPEVQAEVLALVKEYAAHPPKPVRGRSMDSKEYREQVQLHEQNLEALQRQILTYGVGAVPALEQLARTAATAQDRLLAERTCGLMLRLGSIPPADALLVDHDWARQSSSWRTLMRADPATRRQLAEASGHGQTQLARVLRALGEGEMAVVEMLAGEGGGVLASESESVTTALIGALHRFGDDRVHSGIVDLSRRSDTPRSVQRIAERIVADGGWRGADAAQWYEWSKDRAELQTRLAAIFQACRMLRAGDQELLRRILDDQKELEPYLRYAYHEMLTQGLSRNPVPMQLPWTADLVHELLMSIPGETGYGYGLGRHRTTDAGRAMLVEAILADPAELARRMREEDLHPALLYQDYYPDQEFEIWRLADAWMAELARHIVARWDDWSGEDRLAVLDLIVDEDGHVELFSTDRPFPQPLRALLEKEAASGPQGEQVKAVLQRIAEAWEWDR